MTDGDFASELRRRIEIEDELLNSRTTIFLGINGLWAAVVGVSDERGIQTGVAILGIIVTCMWLTCSVQSWQILRRLTKTYLQSAKLGEGQSVEKIVHDVLRRYRHFRPTNILAVWLPGLFLLVWCGLLLYITI